MKHLLTILAVWALPSFLQAQPSADKFQVRAVSYKGESGQGYLHLYTEIPYTSLQFEPTPGGFVAQYRVRAEISRLDEEGKPGNVLISPVWEQTVTAEIFANTIAPELSDLSTYSASLEPGQYLVGMILTDIASSRTFFREISAQARDFSQPAALSDVVLLAGFDPERQSIVPYIAADTEAGDLQIYYEVYTEEPQHLLVTRALLTQNGNAPPNLPNRWTDTLKVDAGRHQQIASIPARTLEFGQYNLTVMLQRLDGDILDQSFYPVSIQWDNLNIYLNNLDEAIEQLAYIAQNNELRELRRAANTAELRERFKAFWDKRDPTPETVRNEAMEEHYYRIDYSNRHFGQQIPGWQSDRGHIFVLHGHPDEVKRQTFSYNNKPWEVWYFFQIGRQFMFVDRTGFGDYELALPVWDDRTRI